MIKFPCLCGEMFTLPDEMAGEMFQCTKCARLVAVPTLDDLQHIGIDGTYDIGDIAAPPKRVEHAPVLNSEEANATVARTEDSNPYDFDEPAQTNAPRYDPFTGELIRAHEVIVTEDTAESKRPKKFQPLSKRDDRGLVEPPPRFAALVALGDMLMSSSIVVLVIMWCIHAMFPFFLFLAIGTPAMMTIPLPFLMGLYMLGYYSQIIQESGPGEKNQLPRPLRDFDFRTDVWDPLVYFFISAAPCFGPSLFLLGSLSDKSYGTTVALTAAAVGGFAFPALFMTVSVDGLIANMRPDRVLGVIFVSGLDYLAVVVAWGLGAALLIDGEYGVFGGVITVFHKTDFKLQKPWYILDAGQSLVMIAVGLYLSYYACMMLGLIWRKHYKDFPWIGQFTERKRVALPPPPRAKKKVAQREEPHFEAEHPELEKEPSR